MSKLKVTGRLISFCLMYCLIYIVQVFFPFYIAYVYKYAKKARSKIYTKWIVNKNYNNRFETMLFSHSGYINKVFKLDNDIFKFKYYIMDPTNEPIETECRLKVYLDNGSSAYLDKLNTSILYYIFYYYFIWIWLDDENNINGIDKRLVNEKSEVFKNVNGKDKFNLINGNHIYTNVFSPEYSKDDTIIDFNRRFYFTKYITLNNYMRDKGTYSKEVMLGKYFGFKYNSRLKRNTIRLFGIDVLERNYRK